MGVSAQGSSGAVSGATSGATTGMAFAGPWGAAIGGVAGGALGLLGGNSAAKAASKLAKEQNKQIRENAVANYQKINLMEKEATGDARESLVQNQVDMATKRGQIEALAAAAGTGGGSINTLVNDVYASGGRNQGTIVENHSRELEGLKDQAEQVRRGAQSQMRQTSIQKPTATGILGDVMGALPSVLDAYDSSQEKGGGLIQQLMKSQTPKSGANIKVN